MSTDFVSRRSILESLERRQLLAQLVIDGTSAADVITLSLDGANVVVDLNGTISTHADTGVTSILINGLEGADTINIESNGANQTTINGGDGLDVVKLSPTANNLNSVVGSVNLLAGADGATLSLFDGSSALNSAYTINSTSIARSGFGGVTFDSALSNLELRATSGNNIFNVHSTPLAPTSIFGLEGNDSCRITPTSQNLDNLGGSFDFYGGNGTDELVFFDGNHAAGDNWSISSTEIARDAIELVTYESESVRIFQGTGDNETVVTDFSSSLLFIDCWEGNDIVRLNGIGAGSRVELVGYIGDDKFYVESSAPTSEIDIAGEVGANEVWIANESRDLSTVAGSVNFVGGGSGDTFGIFDDQHSNQTSYDIESDSIANDVTSGVFTFSNVTNVALHGSSGNNTYNFDSTALGTSTEIVLGSGDDEVRVTDRLGDVSVMQGEVVLQSSDGVDSLFVFDDRTNSNGNFVFTDTKLTGVAFAAMSYAVENVELYCPMGDNDVIVKNASSVKQRLFAGNGIDVIHIDESVTPIDLDTGPGVDRLTLNDDDNQTTPALATIVFDDVINTVNVGPNSVLTIADNVTLRATNENLQGALNFGRHSTYIAMAGSSALPLTVARQYVFAGHNAGNWNGTFAAFRSDYSASTSVGDGIGYARAIDIGVASFNNIPLTANDVIFTQTLYGDANLDRTVTFPDLLKTAQWYLHATRFWFHGDFDYDNATLFPDVLRLAQNYGASTLSFFRAPSTTRMSSLVLGDRSKSINLSSPSQSLL